ncbi:MAG: SulP family inorganic anion transporter [Candidatus Nanopelagicales bacterium]
MARQKAPVRPSVHDLVAGVSVAAVLIPQAVAYALLAGLPPSSGLLAAAAAPIAASFFASSPYLATGPVAITSLLVLGGLAGLAPTETSEYVQLAALLAVFVGAVRLALGLARAGVLAYLMSQPVLVGFTSAAGLIILLSQVPSLLGVSATTSSPVTSALAALGDPGAWSASAVAFGLVTVAAMLLVRRLPATFPIVPIIVVLAIVLSSSTGLGGPQVGELPVATPPNPLDLPWSSTGALLVPAVVIALVGFAEPVAISRRLAAETRQHWSPDRELVSQGAANLASGLVGGYPVGGSFSRSMLNRLAGARTRWSGTVTGLTVLAILPLTMWLATLPKAVLAGIVIAAVVKLVDPRPVIEFWRLSKVQFGVAATTFVATLALAPRVDIAVILGIGLAAVVHLWRELQLKVDVEVEGHTLHVHPAGVLYFASAPSLEQRVNDLLADNPDVTRLLVHLEKLGRVDVTGALSLRELLDEARSAGIDAGVCDVPPSLQRIVGTVLAGHRVDILTDD